MKRVFTCSIDEELVQEIRKAARENSFKGSFKNKSQLVEAAVRKFLEVKS